MDVTTPAFVVDTTDGGATWTKFGNLPAIVRYDPNGTYTLNGISCVSAGGATWSQTGAFNDGGWLTSVSCASTRNCWAAGAASTDALLGTSDGGGS
jgi:photosystem II stability/assembly factor-like uncharacterized protein